MKTILTFSIVLISLAFYSFDRQTKNYVIKKVKNDKTKVHVIKIKKNKMNFVVTKDPTNYDFYINANFYDKGPIGEVIIDNKMIQKKNKNGGYFISNNDGFDFTINSRPKNVNYSSQTHLVGIKNCKLNNSIMYQKWSRIKTFRILLGKDIDGNFMVIHTDRFSESSIKELCEIGISEGMIVGLVYDGGPSVNIRFKDGVYIHGFNAVPNFIRKTKKGLEPPIYIAGNFKD